MLFNSLTFLVFFAIVLALYYAIPAGSRWVLLLVASYYFYMSWRIEYILLIVASTLADYVAALCIHVSRREFPRRAWLCFSLAINLGMLFFFKYYGFFAASAESLLGRWSLAVHFPEINVLLPVGISFYTFQTLGYTIDVYRGKTAPERHLGRFALYVSFFPQLVAGPIERSYHLLPELAKKVDFDYARIRDGLLLMLWGFFKKVVIADRLAEYVEVVYGSPQDYGGLSTLLATYFFSFQIYCDFSGYSDIAIGSALILGVRLMTNFRQPYFSADIREFWGRWHISLSSWFRDYVYIPLGGNRVAPWRWHANLMLVFVISGLWHGANWTFVIWGALHGLYSLGWDHAEPWLQRCKGHGTPAFRFLQIVATFHLVLLGWVFFRAGSLGDAVLVLQHTFDPAFWGSAVNLFRFPADLGVSLVTILFLVCAEFFMGQRELVARLRKCPASLKWILAALLLGSILLLGKFEGADFLYFQF